MRVRNLILCKAGHTLLFRVMHVTHTVHMCVRMCVFVMRGTHRIWVRPTSGIPGIRISPARVYTANVCLLYVYAQPACAKESKD